MNTKKYRGIKPLIILLILIIIALLMVHDSNTRLVTQFYDLEFEKLPESFEGLRIVQISDFHAAVFGNDNEKLISAVQKAEPDIIAITGDFIDSDDQGAVAEGLISQLVTIAPCYYVTGNHEWDSGGLSELFEIMDQHGVTVLQNDFRPITLNGKTIVLAGADDPNGRADMDTPEDLIEDIREEYGDPFILLLYHRNDRLERYSSLGIDLVLSGHAHGGMVRLPFTDGLVGPSREWFPTYTNGLYTMGKTIMFVSRGLGNGTGYPRILNNPHLPVLILHRAAEN